MVADRLTVQRPAGFGVGPGWTLARPCHAICHLDIIFQCPVYTPNPFASVPSPLSGKLLSVERRERFRLCLRTGRVRRVGSCWGVHKSLPFLCQWRCQPIATEIVHKAKCSPGFTLPGSPCRRFRHNENEIGIGWPRQQGSRLLPSLNTIS